jgi:hypothetical protein
MQSGRGLTGPTLESVQYFLAQGQTAADVDQYAATLDRALEVLRISVVDTPPYSEHANVIDEPGLRDAIKERMTYREEAVDRDVQSMSAIMRLRAGRRETQLERCGAVFVTTNSGLVRVSRDFFAVDGAHAAPVTVNDFTLTNLIWLKNPITAPDLPSKWLIANSYALVQPDEALMRTYSAHVEKLEASGQVAPDDYYDLRYSLATRDSLMLLTSGDADVVTDATVFELVKLAEERRTAAARAEVQNELQTAQTAAAREAMRLLRLELRAETWGDAIASLIYGFAIVILIIAGYLGSPVSPTGLARSWVAYVIDGLIVLGIGAGIYSLVTGGSVRIWRRALASAIQAMALRLFYWIGGVQSTD